MKQKLPVIFLFITVMLDSMGIGLIMPVMPDLLIDLGGGTLSKAATWGGGLAAIFAFMQFTCAPTVGSLSDRFGRRPVLLISLAAMSLSYLLMGLAQSMWVMVLARIVGGITSATQSTANAYMADISAPEKKAQNFGLMGAAFGAGFILGPVSGGILSELGPRAPFYAAASLAAINTVFGFFVLSETVTDAIRRPFSWARANPLGAFKYISKLPGLTRLLIVFFLYTIAFFVYPSVWAYFTQERFGWDATMVGVSLGLFGFAMAVVQGGLIRWVIPRVGEHGTVILGYTLTSVTFLTYAMITEGWQVFALAPITALGIIAGPALQGIMSRRASNDQQGELQGVLTSVSALATIISPLLMTNVFGFFTGERTPMYFPGAPFILSMTLVLTALFIFLTRQRAHDTV